MVPKVDTQSKILRYTGRETAEVVVVGDMLRVDMLGADMLGVDMLGMGSFTFRLFSSK